MGSGFSRTYVGPPEGGPHVPTVFLRDVAPIGAGILLSALCFRIDVFLVQWWAGTEKVALYNAVFRVIEGLRLFPAAALAVALPDLCRARNVRPLATVSTLVTGGGVAVAAAAWPFAGSPRRAAVRRTIRRGGTGVSHSAAVVSAPLTELRAHAPAHRLGSAARLTPPSARLRSS